MPSVELWMGAVKTLALCLPFQSVSAARLSLPSFLFPRLHMFSPWYCLSLQWVVTFFMSNPPPLLQALLCCLWMLLIWTPRGSLARPHSSTPWRAPLSSVSTHAQVCVCAWCVFVPGKTDFRFDCKIMLEVMAYLNLCMHNLLCFLVTLLLCTLWLACTPCPQRSSSKEKEIFFLLLYKLLKVSLIRTNKTKWIHIKYNTVC